MNKFEPERKFEKGKVMGKLESGKINLLEYKLINIDRAECMCVCDG